MGLALGTVASTPVMTYVSSGVPDIAGLSIFLKCTITSLFTGGTFFLLKFEQFSRIS